MKALPTFKDLKRIKEEILEIASYLTSTLPEKFTLNTKEQFQAHIRFLLFQKFETNAQCKMQSTLKNMLTEWEDTRNSIAESYLYLVKQIARKYSHDNVERQDFIQEGFQGLLRAIDTYEIAFSVPFESYSYVWIRKYMSHLVENELKQLPVGPEDTEPVSQEPNPEEDLIRKQLEQYLHQCVNSLADVKQEIIQQHYFSREEKTPSLEAVGRRCGLSRERTRQLEKEALKMLSKYL
ncbi:MAG: sigma-70 family RNA polymerase sigma factor [Fibrobacteraceae bacterium]|nr:sigma-70 family RNA polymerase sigma factor [Fibrobacteraceae bacterium]